MRKLIAVVVVALALSIPVNAAPLNPPILLPEAQFAAIAAEATGKNPMATVEQLAALHRVHASAGFHAAAELVAAKAREYGLSDVTIESFPADGKTTYNSFRAYYGWESESATLTESEPKSATLAEYPKLRVALADYSNDADVTAELVDVGRGTAEADYAGKDVRGRIVLAGGGVAGVHAEAVEKRGATGIVSYQPNQTTGWSGDYGDIVRWGHLSPYKLTNTFAFMVSLNQARALQDRLKAGEHIKLHAAVHARMKPSSFEVVSATIPGTDPAAGEIVFSCHLCHQSPGANDNASGAATILEDARVLARLIATGALPKPKRTIRFIWPPEIAGTACYLARHPEIAKRIRAAIHMDMVGGDFLKTKSVFHVTRTPASLPSYVNDVAGIFGEYVIEGSRRAAATGDTTAAFYDAEGTKNPLVADLAPFSMGSDHDVYEEGSFRIPTIYLNDWPDVFIHTSNDVPSNLDATKLRRVAIIGAASGYFLAAAGTNEARRLAEIVYVRSAGRQARALEGAVDFGSRGDVTVERFHQAHDIFDVASRGEMAALDSVAVLAPDDSVLLGMIRDWKAGVAERQKQGDALLSRVVEIPAAAVHEDPAADLVPTRNPKVVGGMSTYYYDYIEDHLGAPADGSELVQYETLNLVDGKRTLREITRILFASYGDVAIGDVVGYARVLEKAGVITFDKPQTTRIERTK